MDAGRYTLRRSGPQNFYSAKRLRNEARRIACRMAHDGMLEMVNRVRPADGEVIAECRRVLAELSTRGRLHAIEED